MMVSCGWDTTQFDFVPSGGCSQRAGRITLDDYGAMRVLRLMHSGLSFSDSVEMVLNCPCN